MSHSVYLFRIYLGHEPQSYHSYDMFSIDSDFCLWHYAIRNCYFFFFFFFFLILVVSQHCANGAADELAPGKNIRSLNEISTKSWRNSDERICGKILWQNVLPQSTRRKVWRNSNEILTKRKWRKKQRTCLYQNILQVAGNHGGVRSQYICVCVCLRFRTISCLCAALCMS